MARAGVEEAMRATPRAGYLPAAVRHLADVDAPVALGHGSTCSQPSTVRTMLRLLDVRPGDRVLDVGSGSGWTTAVLARLTGPQGSVLGVELEADLVEAAARRLERDGLAHAAVRVADPTVLGAPEAAPFDRVLVSAMAHELPSSLVGQLGEGGVMVLPLGGRLVRVEVRGGVPRTDAAPGSYRFVPLRTVEAPAPRRGRRWPWRRGGPDWARPTP